MKNTSLFILLAAGVLAIAGWSGVLQKRQVWEYKGFSLLMQGATVVMYENGKPMPGKADVGAKAAELGEQGWELVSVASWGESTMFYWFKRPK